ncbi:hypothetical protein LguiA_021717 [Lonicera macranthoides]
MVFQSRVKIINRVGSKLAELNKPDAKNGLVESGVPTNEKKSSGSPSTEKQKHHYLRLQEEYDTREHMDSRILMRSPSLKEESQPSMKQTHFEHQSKRNSPHV